MGADRQVAPAPELGQEGSLGVETTVRVWVVELSDGLARDLVLESALDRQGPLAYLRQHRPDRQHLCRELAQTQALERGVGHDYRPIGRYLAEPGPDVAPELLETQVGPEPCELGPASRSSRRHVRSGTEL